MSHHSDDNMLIATSDSFWEPGNYKKTTKRIEDGYKLCQELISLVGERADIERNYAKSLKAWSKKWNDAIEKGPEYGTTEAAWKGALVEADRRCDLHSRIRDSLTNDVINKVKQWQKDSYHKSMMNIKEKKDMDDNFKKAQKPWTKLLQKVEKTKNDYHTACKTEKSASNQERNATGDTSFSADQVKKMQERVQKSKDEVQKCREKYELSLQEINQYNPKYMEDMTVVFDKCQEMEAQRLNFIKTVLFEIHKYLNLSDDITLNQIYEEFYHTINNADYEKDLKWWSNNHGVNMAMNWPQFEDYSTQKSIKKEVPNKPSTVVTQSTEVKPRIEASSSPSNTITNGSANKANESNPFEEEEWEENDALVDHGEPGVPVKALYDYDGAENDELSFKIGDVFEKLEDEDEQGWCKGRKDGRVGLYPANYVDVVSH
ncbi:protein kinase C and casein kinase substrate in neurons protein 1 isoform X2 [Diabrotica virgifera virgifera]|uniref:Protein kinase C and casein kinase substrate in neurons protein 1 n=1 Tax=Diabrotica virgifera virgifera TaxID=50390 RepID=A0ABM5KFX7_DIAVI|nr:protein kinase C and casein kinase substrate in neurons protein 1 isoform X2 [Diabrotica virgifera virgifera]